MLTLEEISRSLTGAWLLMKGKEAGMRAFDVSIDGFWRSFGAILLMLPLYLPTLLAQRAVSIEMLPVTAADFPDGLFFLVSALGIAIDWIAFPLVAAAIAGPLGFSHRYIPLIVARNWTSVLALVPYALPQILYALGIASGQMMMLLTLIAVGIVLRYRYVVTKAALGGQTSVIVGLVALDFVLGLFLSELIGQMVGVT